MPPLFTFALLTWRECVVGMKPTEATAMTLDRTWDVPARFTSQGTIPGAVRSDNLGSVQWRMRDDVLFGKPCRVLRSEAFDAKCDERTVEEVWVTPTGELLRQWEEHTSKAGRETADAAFAQDHLDLTRVDAKGRTNYSEMVVADMAAVQRRFQPLEGPRKEFLRLDGLAGTLRKVTVERAGRFRGTWSGDAYEGTTYRFTMDGVETSAMLTAQGETVQVAFSDEVKLVLRDATPSRRKGS